jgi:NAD(P)-dependent dehydrogenase (short-subunit alcohol dehydrogenase family)
MTRSFDVGATADAALEWTIVGSFSRIGFEARRRLFGWDTARPAAMNGRTAVVTGATSGLGLAAAHALVRCGAAVCLVGRDAQRAEASRQAIRTSFPRAEVEVVIADFAVLDEVRDAAGRIATVLERVDVILHNAGVLVHEPHYTVDGLELTAQVHVVAPFLLTSLLLPDLHRAGDGRVVTVSSGGMYAQRLDLASLRRPDPFDGVRAYANAKRAQVVLNEEWARRHGNTGVAFHAMHPGWADTPGLQTALPRFRRLVQPLLRSAEQGADTEVWLAGTPVVPGPNGSFWLDRRRRATTRSRRTETAPGDAERLWEWCAAEAGMRDSLAAS